MTNCFILNENITNGFQSVTLNFISMAAILCGILVIVSKNPIVSVLFLIGLFLSVSIYLMLLGLNFIGLSYLLVYVGAVSILFLFILMLINVRISEIVSYTSNSIPLAIIIGSLFFSAVNQALPLTNGGNVYGEKHDTGLNTILNPLINKVESYLYNLYDLFAKASNKDILHGEYTKYFEFKNKPLEYVTSQTWDIMLAETSHINTLGNVLYTSFPLWILLTSLVLLLAMVGAILITIKN
jgi:NADH-ubiquinone oxidoreductase chain 6